jgi:putative membrane protein
MFQILPLLSTSFIVISAIFVALGWKQIIKGNRDTHQRLMLLGAFFALAFFIMYLTRTLVIGSTPFGGPDYLKIPYLIFLLTHIVLATTAAVFGIITLLHAFKSRFAKHKRIGRWTAVIWFITATSGVMVYLLLYIIYPSGETKSLLDAIFGL